MTRTAFFNLCAMLYIEPSIALENEKIVQALKDGAHENEIAALLESEF